jgi:hypothetical protein
MPEQLQVPPIPFAFERAMRIWQRLHKRRQTGMGLGNLTYPDLYGYSVVHSDPLSGDDIAAIEIIEEEFHSSRVAADERRNKTEAAKSKRT